MSKIETKIRAGKYTSLAGARRAITGTKGLRSKERERLHGIAIKWFEGADAEALAPKNPKIAFNSAYGKNGSTPPQDIIMDAAVKAYSYCAAICKQMKIDMKSLITDMMKVHGIIKRVEGNPNMGTDEKKGEDV